MIYSAILSIFHDKTPYFHLYLGFILYFFSCFFLFFSFFFFFFLFFDFFIFFLCLDEKSFYKIEVTKCVKGRSASGVVLVELKPSLDNNKLRISSTFVVFSSTCCFEFTKFCCFPECYVTKR